VIARLIILVAAEYFFEISPVFGLGRNAARVRSWGVRCDCSPYFFVHDLYISQNSPILRDKFPTKLHSHGKKSRLSLPGKSGF